nr:T-cell immunoglobulin and mucin domain-containing protein 4-like [Loxodonta africana]
MAILVHNEVESEQMKMSYNSDLLMIIAPCVGFVVFLLLLGFLLRGKVTKTNCLQKNTRQENVGGNKNVLNDVLLGTEDEDGVFTL